jgi:protein-tyrosine phosphatase
MIGGPPSVLFVCRVNVCRSPLAQAAFVLEASRAGLQANVYSAGIENHHAGRAPNRHAQAIANAAGIDISSYRARQVSAEDFGRFSHIFAMDSRILADLKALEPADCRTRPRLLLDLVPGREGTDVRDPFHNGEVVLERTWQDVSLAARALVRHLAGG